MPLPDSTDRDEVCLANAAQGTWSLFGLFNSVDAVTDDQGWTLLPFGMWQHSAGYQRFFKPEADNIVSAFRSVVGQVKRALVGLPVYKGHPDNPAMANDYPDKTEYGQISDMEVRDGGLAIRHVLSSAGSAIVSKLGWDRISPNWLVNDTGEERNGLTVYAPYAIKSMGLVKKPNIPNLSLVNCAHNSTMNREQILKLLALANEATDADIIGKLTELLSRPTADALANAQNENATLKATNATLTTEAAAQKRRADDAAVLLANVASKEIESVLANAITTGRIAEADKPVWETVLKTNLEAGKKALANVAAKVKTRASTDAAELGRRTAEMANGMDGANPAADGNDMANKKSIQELVSNEMDMLKKGGCSQRGNSLYNRAFANIKTRHPNLFQTDGDTPDDSITDGQRDS